MTDQQYQALKRRLASDREFLIVLLEAVRSYFMSKVGELTVDILLWLLTKLFSWGRFLIWPLILMLEAKGYIKLSDGLLQILKKVLK